MKKIKLIIDYNTKWILKNNSNDIKVDFVFIPCAIFSKNKRAFLESSETRIRFTYSNKLIALFYNRKIKYTYEKN